MDIYCVCPYQLQVTTCVTWGGCVGRFCISITLAGGDQQMLASLLCLDFLPSDLVFLDSVNKALQSLNLVPLEVNE